MPSNQACKNKKKFMFLFFIGKSMIIVCDFFIQGPTPSPGTGPDGPFEGKFYEYMDAFAIPKGEKAILESPPIQIPSMYM